MHRFLLSKQQILMMLELCLDAEERCDKRIAAARDANDYSAAAFEVQLKEQYENMKDCIFEHMKADSATMQEMQAMLQRIRRSVEKYGRSAADAI